MAWKFTEHWGEYFALLFWAGVGMMFLVASEELLTLFLTLETMTLCLYMATAFESGRRRSAEGGLKYFVYGSVSSAMFLFGLSLIYGLTGTTRLEAIHQVLVDQAQAGVAQNRATVRAGYALVEPQLDAPWALGADFTLADCAALPALYYADYAEKLPPGLAAYVERLKARPSVARVLSEAEPWFQYFPLRNG